MTATRPYLEVSCRRWNEFSVEVVRAESIRSFKHHVSQLIVLARMFFIDLPCRLCLTNLSQECVTGTILVLNTVTSTHLLSSLIIHDEIIEKYSTRDLVFKDQFLKYAFFFFDIV